MARAILARPGPRYFGAAFISTKSMRQARKARTKGFLKSSTKFFLNSASISMPKFPVFEAFFIRLFEIVLYTLVYKMKIMSSITFYKSQMVLMEVTILQFHVIAHIFEYTYTEWMHNNEA